MINSGYFTSESVTEGHPDKICDQISDKILDSILNLDPNGRVACEVMAGHNFIVVTGELNYQSKKQLTKADFENLVKETAQNIGYDRSSFGLDYRTCDIMIRLNQQSSDIALGVDTQGAGDQGMMFGFATNETENRMPLPITVAHHITQRLAEVRKNKTLDFLGPDGKSQVTFKYKNKKAQSISSIVVSTQHQEGISQAEIKEKVIKEVIYPVLPKEFATSDIDFHINPTGKFVIGGPEGDVGLTGRKIIVDTYGGFSRHGGGAFSGKDGTKVDRSGAYMARYIAKNIVASTLADVCEIQLSYVIGVAEPVSVYVDTFDTGKVPDENISNAIREIFSLTPSGIIKHLRLDRPIFFKTSTYGHFGRSLPDFTWEKEDKVEEIKNYFKI